MSGIKLKKHKQSKFLTIMLIPYSSKKTKSLRIPHWLFYAVFCTAGGLMLVAFLFSLRASYFENHAESLNVEWNKSIKLNTQLLEEKQEIESNVEKQKESFEQQLDSYESQLEYFNEKTRELEERINELNATKEEIYNLISSSADHPIARYTPDASMGGPHIKVAATTLESIYQDLDERLTAEIQEYASLIAEAKRIKPFLDAKPSIWPVQGTVTSEMGERPNPFGYGTESHSGLDIAVSAGTYVKATGNGTITYSDWESGYGYLVVIDHGYGYETYYGHNSWLLYDVGEKVLRGDNIAVSGSTGRSTGPHVHYEVRLNGALQNPRDYLY